MRSLFAKIVLAQGVTVILALAVVALLTRASLNRGFMEYLEQQEATALATLAPALAELYETRGDWDFLRDRPGNWDRILRHYRPGPGPARPKRPGAKAQPPPWQPPEGHVLERLSARERLRLRQRLFLLDEEGQWIAGAAGGAANQESLEPILVGRSRVGAIGFLPSAGDLPPEASRFLAGQMKIMAMSLLLALLLAGITAWLLARHLSRPVRRLDRTVTELSKGDYETRAVVDTADEIGRLARNVNHLARTLERNQSLQRRWMADIAHELRTPLAVLKGEVDAVADGVRDHDERILQSIGEEVDQLSALVDDLQALALADAGALEVRKETTDFSELLRQAGATYAARFAAREIRLEIDAGQNIEVTADLQRLRQLVNNLLENGCKYIEAGGLLRLRLTRAGRQVDLISEDSGPGVSDAQLPRLFERFYRVEESRARRTGGSGLGLSICKNIVEAHGGSIRADHSELGGLMIALRLPE